MTSAPPPHILARYDFESYCAFMQPGYQKAKHTRYLCYKLDEVKAGRIRRLIVCMPPRHSKSWHISRLFAPYYLGHYPHKQVIGATHSGGLATDFGRDVRDFIEDEKHRLVFPGVRCKQDSRAANKFHIEKVNSRHRGVYVSLTRTGRKSGRGADLELIDDLLDEMETYSPAAILQAQRALRGLRTRLQKDGAIVLLMNRTGEDDPIAYALREMAHEGWEVINMQAIAEQDERYEMPGGEVWERKAGEALWPEMFPLEALEALRTGMPIHEWSAKYQQRPIPIGTKLVDEAWFEDRRYDDDPEDILREAMRVTVTEDTSKGTATGARTAIGLIAETRRGAFLLRVWAERWQMPQIIEKSKDAAVAGNPHMVLIEDKSTGESLIQLLRAEQAV